VERKAGNNVEIWDGRDDTGRSLPVGEYRWRGLRRQALESRFIGAFNSPGNPPWNTWEVPEKWYLCPGGRGGWLSDHERPLCLHASGEMIFIGAAIAEAGHSIIQVDTEGRKQWGTLWLSLSGANAIAVDGDVLYVAGEKGWMKDSLAVNRIDLKTHGWVPNPPEVRKKRTDACFVKESSSDFCGIQGMALVGQYIVLSLSDQGRLVCFDRETAELVKEVPLPGAGAILGIDSTHVLGISGQQVVSVDLADGTYRAVVTNDLDQPSGLSQDSQGRLYVCETAPDEQCVKVFWPDGVLLRRICIPGGRNEGLFYPLVMGNPVAVAVDAKDHVWVAEHDFHPKRVSVWTSTGSPVRDFIGPPFYGGGGALIPCYGDIFADYRGVSFTFKEWPASSRIHSVLYQPEKHGDLPYPQSKSAIPQYPVKRYRIHDDGWGVPGVFIAEQSGDQLVPRIIFGELDTLRKAWAERRPDFLEDAGLVARGVHGKGVFLWQDHNRDGCADPSEVSIRSDLQYGALWGMRSWPTLDLYARSSDSLVVFSPEPSANRLNYDLEAGITIPLPEIVREKGICATIPDPDGGVIINCGGGGNQGDPENVLLSLAPDGRIRWTYPNPFPANWHNSPLPRTGDILHTLNVEGFATLPENRGRIFQLNGNKGTRYLFTTDGLFVGELFGDMRINPVQQNLLTAEPNMRLDQHSLGDECFFGWMGDMPDGRILQVVGKDSSNVARIDGLDTLRRMEGYVSLTQPAPPLQSLPAVERGPVRTVAAGGFGLGHGWEKLVQQSFPQDEPLVQFAVGYTSQSLNLWLSVSDTTPFTNGGGDANTLFHTGDAIDFRWASDPGLPANRESPEKGDCRFVIAMHEGVPVVMKYVFIDDTCDAPPVVFASPAGTESVACVEKITAARVVVERDEQKGYRIAIAIPWNELGEPALPSGLRRGDIGVLFGDASGTRTVRRCYYFDQESQVVSDIPSEVRVCPSNWGEFLF
jgi:hypothetical protein